MRLVPSATARYLGLLNEGEYIQLAEIEVYTGRIMVISNFCHTVPGQRQSLRFNQS